jgi:hypothetical protein
LCALTLAYAKTGTRTAFPFDPYREPPAAMFADARMTVKQRRNPIPQNGSALIPNNKKPAEWPALWH